MFLFHLLTLVFIIPFRACAKVGDSACAHLWGGRVALWLVRSTPERAVRVRALAGDILLCSWARHFTLTVPLSTQVYKWVPANCWGNLTKLRGSDLRWTSIPSRGSRNTSSRFMLQKPGYAPAAMSQPWFLGSKASHFTGSNCFFLGRNIAVISHAFFALFSGVLLP